ncbi:MAG: hypothetical protein Q8M26_11415 [Pseudolabrys sp.]|nr:hypothetical protein [Pseudolabrys sp.]
MFYILAGALTASAGGFGLWTMLPRHGIPHRYSETPFLQSLIPVAIVSALAIGVTMVLGGASEFF